MKMSILDGYFPSKIMNKYFTTSCDDTAVIQQPITILSYEICFSTVTVLTFLHLSIIVIILLF